MDPSTNFSLTQLVILWTLLGFLLTWMVVFTVLALRSHSRETWPEDVPAPSRPHPGISSILPKFHMVTSQSTETANADSTMPSEVAARS
jgi:hypothetical protein